MLFIVWRVYNMRSALLEQNSGKFWQEQPTVISDALSTANTNADGVIPMVSVPLGAYVTKVQVLATVAVANQEFNIGDGDSADRYIDGLTTLAQYDIAEAPNVNGVANDEVAGRFYAAADTIDFVSTITASADTAAGSIKLLVWYFVL